MQKLKYSLFFLSAILLSFTIRHSKGLLNKSKNPILDNSSSKINIPSFAKPTNKILATPPKFSKPSIPSNQALGTYNPGVLVCASTNGIYYLNYQTDGNLVLYSHKNGVWKSLWATMSNVGVSPSEVGLLNFDPQIAQITIRTNWFHLVWYDNHLAAGTPFTYILQDDGNFVLYWQAYQGYPAGSASTSTDGGKTNSNHYFTH